jgi:hypothetical protein
MPATSGRMHAEPDATEEKLQAVGRSLGWTPRDAAEMGEGNAYTTIS